MPSQVNDWPDEANALVGDFSGIYRPVTQAPQLARDESRALQGAGTASQTLGRRPANALAASSAACHRALLKAVAHINQVGMSLGVAAVRRQPGLVFPYHALLHYYLSAELIEMA